MADKISKVAEMLAREKEFSLLERDLKNCASSIQKDITTIEQSLRDINVDDSLVEARAMCSSQIKRTQEQLAEYEKTMHALMHASEVPALHAEKQRGT